MKHLIILNEASYGSERSYNGLRLAKAPVHQHRLNDGSASRKAVSR